MKRATTILAAGAALGALLAAAPAQSQPIAYYQVDVAQALARDSLTTWTQRRDAARQAQPQFAVETIEDFIKIEQYYDKFLGDGVAVHAFRSGAGDNIQCIDIATQQSVIAAGLTRDTMPLRPSTTPTNNEAPAIGDARTVGNMQGIDGSLDEQGRARACPDGSFPKVIFAKENLYSFRKFEDIFRKHPRVVKSDGTEPPAGEVHDYAHAAQAGLSNKGLVADFNLWSPTVAVASEFSLSQLWVARGSGTDLQTTEVGWQVYSPMYGDNRSHLFVYSTSDGYSGNSFASGCYNLTCGRFVQTNNSVAIAGAFSNYSTVGGTQYSVRLAFIRDDGGAHHWWMYVNDTAIGYYPNTLFDSNGIANLNGGLDYGGEIVNNLTGGVNTNTDMGSGQWPTTGLGNAAFVKMIRYVNTSFAYANATGLTGYTTKKTLWDIGAINVTSDATYGTYFLFGGPGNDGTAPTASLVNSILPTSRSVQVGTAATAFNTTINTGTAAGTGCGLTATAAGSIPATFSYQTTNPATNQPTGTANTPGSIAAGQSQSYVFSLAPTAAFAPTDVNIVAKCTNSSAGPTITGVNTILVSASATPVPDIIALAASGDPGYVDIPGANGTGVFAVATANVGATANIITTLDTGGATLPVQLSICQTNPQTGACTSPIGSSASTTIAAGTTPTFGIFVKGTGTVANNPATNRVFVRFKDTGGNTRGSTSVAVRTQ